MGFLDNAADSGLLGGLASAGQGFLRGMGDAEDRKMKQIEFQAKERAAETANRQKDFDKRLEGKLGGLNVPPLSEKFDPGAATWDTQSPKLMTASRPAGAGGLNAPERIGIMKDNQASSAVDKIVNDSQLKSHVQRIQGADRILSQLQEVKSGHIVDTSQFLNDLNTEYVNFLTGSNNTALGKQERTEYRTYAGDLANVIQKIKAKPESVRSPEIMNQLEKSVSSLRGNYQRNLIERGKLLKRNYAHNPGATRQQDEKIQEMAGQFGQQPQGLLGPQSNKPKTVIQNGHTYTLNPATGAYE